MTRSTAHHDASLRIALLTTLCLIGTLSGLPGTALYAGETIDDPTRGFILKLPDAFTPLENPPALPPNTIKAFIHGEFQEGQINVVLLICDQGKPLPHLRLQRSDLGPDFRGSVFRATWQGLEVPGTEVNESEQGLKATTYSVLVPIERQGIQLVIVGPTEQKAELKALLLQVLAGFSGPSNWPSSPAADARKPPSPGSAITTMIIIFLLGLIVLWLISKKAPRGTVLAIGVALFLGGNATQPRPGAIESLVVACAKTIGLAGILLGILDLRRGRPSPKNQNTANSMPTGVQQDLVRAPSSEDNE